MFQLGVLCFDWMCASSSVLHVIKIAIFGHGVCGSFSSCGCLTMNFRRTCRHFLLHGGQCCKLSDTRMCGYRGKPECRKTQTQVCRDGDCRGALPGSGKSSRAYRTGRLPFLGCPATVLHMNSSTVSATWPLNGMSWLDMPKPSRNGRGIVVIVVIMTSTTMTTATTNSMLPPRLPPG